MDTNRTIVGFNVQIYTKSKTMELQLISRNVAERTNILFILVINPAEKRTCAKKEKKHFVTLEHVQIPWTLVLEKYKTTDLILNKQTINRNTQKSITAPDLHG